MLKHSFSTSKVSNVSKICIVISLLTALVLLSIPLASHFGRGREAELPTEVKVEQVFVPVIMYHSILRDESQWGDYVLSPEVLAEDIRYLKENGYEFILTADLIDYVHSGKPLPKKPVILTFDDGCYNFLSYVEPILRDSGAKAVLSVVGSFAENENGKQQYSSYSYLNYEQIRLLSKCGYVEIASHSYDMHKLGLRRGALKKEGESDEDYRSAFISDLLLSIDGLEQNCGITPQVYTYPYGLVSEESKEYVKACHFTASYGVEEKPNFITRNSECLYCMNRYNRPSGISTEDFMKRALSTEQLP